LTFDYADTETGEVTAGRIAPADRAHLADWLHARFGAGDEVTFAVEACTGWRYVTEEFAAAGLRVLLAEPADTAATRGRKKRAKTDRADARLLRELVASERVPTCWIPPRRVLEDRALLELYHDLRREHTAWVQRVHAVLFHQGAGQVQVAGALRMLDVLEELLVATRRRLEAEARALRGARLLHDELYGVGPVTALALTCWLGGADRFHSSRQAVRFAGLDVTVYSSDGKRSPGHLSRQGPPVLRWCLYEAGKAHARTSAPDHAYYAQVKERVDGKRAALSEARKIVREACHLLTALGDDAFAPPVPRPRRPAAPRPGDRPAAA
jgi:transposase